MAIIKNLDQSYIDHHLACPPGKQKDELVDPLRTGLYIEVRASSPGQGTYYLRYKDAASKTCHQKLGRTSEFSLAEARRKAKQLKASITMGADPRGEEKAKKAVPTLTAFFDDSYLPHVTPRKRSWKKDDSLFKNYLKEKFGTRRLNEFRRQEVQEFHAGLLGRKLSPASADHVVKLLRQMMNKAVEWDVIPVSPIARIKLFNADNRLEHYMDPSQLQGLLNVLQVDDNRAVCNVALFLLCTGARLNEALDATWDQVDMQSRVWRISAATSKSKRVRSVPLNDSAIELLGILRNQDPDRGHEGFRGGADVLARVLRRAGNQAFLFQRRQHESSGIGRLTLAHRLYRYAADQGLLTQSAFYLADCNPIVAIEAPSAVAIDPEQHLRVGPVSDVVRQSGFCR